MDADEEYLYEAIPIDEDFVQEGNLYYKCIL